LEVVVQELMELQMEMVLVVQIQFLVQLHQLEEEVEHLEQIHLYLVDQEEVEAGILQIFLEEQVIPLLQVHLKEILEVMEDQQDHHVDLIV
jgi:hypothetical protein